MFKAYRYLPALLLVAGVAAAAPACAAQTYGYGYPRTNGGYGRDIERRAYDNGYREGLEEGRNDARRNRNFSPERHGEYRPCRTRRVAGCSSNGAPGPTAHR